MIKDVVLCQECVHYDEGYCKFTDQDWDPEDYCNYGEKKMEGLDVIGVKLDPGAVLPVRAHDNDAGMDLFVPESDESLAVFPGGSITIDTGVHVEIPKGYVGLLMSKSGLNVKHDLTGEGVIDAGYTGSITVKLYNHGKERYTFHGGEKIIQMLIMKCETPNIMLVKDIVGGERGDNGFGSTGR